MGEDGGEEGWEGWTVKKKDAVGTMELFKGVTQLKTLLYSACYLASFVFSFFLVFSFLHFFSLSFLLLFFEGGSSVVGGVISNWYSPQIHFQSRTGAAPCATALR